MSREFMAERAAAPFLSRRLDDVYRMLRAVNPKVKNFSMIMRDDGDDVQTRIIPLSDEEAEVAFSLSDDLVSYAVATDEEHRVIEEEKM